MRERPILFTPAMVRAVLDGTKTQTRRVVRPSVYGGFVGGAGEEADVTKWGYENGHGEWMVLARGLDGRRQYGSSTSIPCPYGEPGDQLWVRESWRVGGARSTPNDGGLNRIAVDYRASPELTATPWCYPRGEQFDRLFSQVWQRQFARCRVPNISCCMGWDAGDSPDRWRPSIFMPRWASRLQLEVTELRIERVQDITAEDAIAEGIARSAPAHRLAFAHLWDSINAKRGYGWDANPWVWVVGFRALS